MIKISAFLLFPVFLFSCTSQTKEEKTEFSIEKSSSVENTYEDSVHEGAARTLEEKNALYRNLFNVQEWVAIKNNLGITETVQHCTGCWHDHEYKPFDVKDTLEYFFISETRDTIASSVVLANEKMNPAPDYISASKNESCFFREITIWHPGFTLGGWLHVGTTAKNVIEQLGEPDSKSAAIIRYMMRENDHLWFVGLDMENEKVVAIRIGQF